MSKITRHMLVPAPKMVPLIHIPRLRGMLGYLADQPHTDAGAILEPQRGPEPLHIEPRPMVRAHIEATLYQGRFPGLLDATHHRQADTFQRPAKLDEGMLAIVEHRFGKPGRGFRGLPL